MSFSRKMAGIGDLNHKQNKRESEGQSWMFSVICGPDFVNT